MKAFLDTSVLVAVFYGEHKHHIPSRALLERYEPDEVCCGAHSLFEVYATLTRMPGSLRASPEEALLFVESLRMNLTVIALTPEEAARTLTMAAATQVMGGSTYDAALAGCAEKADAEALYTWSLRDYQRLWPAVADRVRSPDSSSS
ncbi:MAG: PIN domain-containing protein [Bryobacterales bacterium]|nr:PIN domain-containing protein [Acidobacteriota bacterium]MCB9384991.1 PIN domain-containing protein [Bryobacterales bacterium]